MVEYCSYSFVFYKLHAKCVAKSSTLSLIFTRLNALLNTLNLFYFCMSVSCPRRTNIILTYV